MGNISVIIKLVLILNLINSYFALFCYNTAKNDYKLIKANNPFQIKTNPENEVCLKYEFGVNDKKTIGLSFLKANSYTVQVLIYDSYESIKVKDGEYEGSIEKYFIALDKFKEIDVSKINKNNIFIIIRETQFYYYLDYCELYDSQQPIVMKENTPITINNFMSNKEYKFIFESKTYVTISYSTRIKNKKNIIITRDGEIENEQMDDKDFLHDSTPKQLNLNSKYQITIQLVSEISETHEEEQFSIIYYENMKRYGEIKKNDNKKINYLSNNDKLQIFYFYIDTKNNSNSDTINFKLDYNDKKNKYIYIYTTRNSSILPIEESKFSDNELEYKYDKDSDDYVQYYFSPDKENNYILIKVQIKMLDDYSLPKYFNISYGEEVIDNKVSTNGNYEITTSSYIPTYIKFDFQTNNNKNFLFYAPCAEYSLLINGDILEKNQINTNYIKEHTDLFEINQTESITARILSYERNINFFYQQYNPNDVTIIYLEDRITDLYSKEFTEGDCKGNSFKYIIFKYDYNKFSFGQQKYSNYWTTNGNMNVLYKNNSEYKNSFFPTVKLDKEVLYSSDTHIDMFSINCVSPGTFYIRPLKKKFSEITHELTDNTIRNIEILSGKEIIQLYSKIKDAPPHVFFSIITFSENEIKIDPDTPELFKSNTINKNTRYFSLEIDTQKFKMDQMAIGLISDSINEIEIIETTDCKYCTYQKLNEKGNVEINHNNFVLFLDGKDKDCDKILIEFNNLDGQEVAYGIVNLASKNESYIPSAFNFPETKKEFISNSIEFTNESKEEKFKPNTAFIFSVKSDSVLKYNIDITFLYKSNEELFNIILLTCLILHVLSAIIFVIVYIMKTRSKMGKIKDINDDNYESLMP